MSERARKYFDNDPELYTSDYLGEHDLFEKTKLIFNPVPKTTFTMSALTMQESLEVESDKADKIKEFWDYNGFQKQKYQLLLHLILNKKAIIELVSTDEGIVISIHDPESVEIKKLGGKTVFAKITGTIEKFDPNEKKFTETEIERIYYNTKEYKYIEEYEDGEETENSRPLTWEFIPVIDFKTEYNLEPMFCKVDEHNQINAFLNSIFFIHGDPIIWDTLTGSQFSDDTKQNMASSRGKAMKLLHLGNEGQMEYLEMQGNIAKLMAEEKKHLEEILVNDYPEYKLADLLSSGDPSGDALEIKAIDVISKIKSIRGDLSTGIMAMNSYALQMAGNSPPEEQSINYGDILPGETSKLIDKIVELRGMGMMTKETAIKMLPDIYGKPEEELEKLEDEAKADRENAYNELNNHANS